MIEIEFSKCIDSDIFGTFRTFKRNLLLGKSFSADIIIEDPSLEPAHLIFKSIESGILIESATRNSVYYSNGKKVVGMKLHKAGDKIRCGNTVFTIKSYVYEPPIDYRQDIGDKIEELRNDSGEELLENIEKEILWVEKELNAGK